MLPKSITAREFVAALIEGGFSLRRVRGSHRVYRSADGRRVVVAYHRLSQSFPLGTLRGMIADTGWTEKDLKRLGLDR